MTISWKEFWNTKNTVYFSERHIVVSYKALEADVQTLLPKKRPLTFLDYGCGEARMAKDLSQNGVTVLLHDAVPRVHQQLQQTFSKNTLVRVLSESEMESLPVQSVEVILVHSVLQYLSKEQFINLLIRFHTILTRGGVLYLGDIVSPKTSTLQDVYSLLRAGIRYGFLLDVLFGLVRTFFSNYRAVRSKNGFTTYTEEEVVMLLGQYGFTAERLPKNIGISTHRMLIRAVKA
jgi:ubiquinone/menaquinone biosynthesis C-methylase UbiE